MLFVFPLFLLISQSLCKDFVPVIIWGEYDKPVIEGGFPGLSQLRSFHFSQLLHKLIAKRPHVLLFTEENLSIEDFSWRDDQDSTSFPNLYNVSIMNKDFLYLPSVESPMSVFHQLINHGYSIAQYVKESPPVLTLPSILIATLPEPGLHDTRPTLLRAHDAFIASLASEAVEKYKNVLIAFTGRHASFVEPLNSRLRREAEEKDENTSNEIVMVDDEEKSIFLVTAAPIELKMGENITYLTRSIYGSKQTSKGGIITLDVKFEEESISLDFTFNAKENQAWQLEDVRLEFPKVTMTSKTFIGAPDRFSYFCAKDIVFQGLSSEGVEYVLTLRRLQAQPLVAKNEFGPVSDCVPYFTSQIWSGLLISTMLIGVAIMSILFILDIHTMDKFDDPKGKMITIPNE